MSSTEYGPFLPHELLMEVLSFLPVKSLMRFRCVCKSWNFLVFNHTFVKLHLQRSPPSILCNVGCYFTDVKRQGYFTDVRRYQKLLQCYSIESLFKDPSSTFHDFSLLIPYGDSIIGVCNGLVCLLRTTHKARLTDAWIQCWNPATRVISQKLHFHSELSVFNYPFMGFGYDNSRDIYKVVAVFTKTSHMETQVRVQCLGENCSRKVDSWSGRFPCLSGKGYYLHGTLNWVALLAPRLDGSNRDVIFSFDLRDETYKYLLSPNDSPKCQDYPVCILGLLRGCLSLSYYNDKTHRLNVWQMKEFGVAESWSQVFNVCCDRFKPLCMSHNGNLLLTSWSFFRLFMYNRRQNTLDLVRNHVRGFSLWEVFQYYVQSLVLPY